MGSVSIKSVLSLAFAFGLSAFALTASADPKCSAVYDAATTTLTLYYDEVDHSSEGAVYALPAAKPDWPADFKNATTIVFDSSFHNWKPSSCTQWFYLFTKASSFVGIENWDVSECTNMRRLFCKCPVTILDLSTFETGKCTAFNEMFSGCGNLVTIYASDNFDTSKGTNFDDMFKSCSKLIGGNNTKFDAANDYKTYARIDLPNQPGYFTGKDTPIPPTIESVDFTDLTHESVTIITKGKNINGGSVTIELWAGEKVAEKSLDDFGSAAFAELTPETTYTVKVTAKNEYGSVTDESCSFTTQPLPVPTISGVTVDTVLHDTVMLTVSGESIADVEVKVELLEGDEIRATKTGEAFGEFVFEGLTPETTYTVKVTATNQYGPSVDETASFTTLEKPADEWKVVLDDTGKAGVVSWGAWEFGITVKDGAVTVGKYTKTPSSPMPLDFSLPIVDGNGGTYIIVKIDTQFGQAGGSGDDARAVPFPEAEFVSLLTLPSTVTEISNYAFTHCVNLIGAIPADNVLKAIGVAAFVDTQLSGDVVLPEIETVSHSAFWGTKITSIKTGDKLETFDSNYDRGALQKCVCLTNVSFDATKSISLLKNFTFYGCSALEELDLSMVLNFEDPTKEGNSPFGGCASLKKLIFGAVTNLPPQVLYTPALETVVFEGVPPVGFVSQGGDHTTRYLSPVSYYKTIDTPIHDTIFDKKSITTYVHRKLCRVKNEAGKCWNDYAANGQIGAAKKNPARNTTWAAEYVYEGVDLANRPLLTIEPGTGLLLLVK